MIRCNVERIQSVGFQGIDAGSDEHVCRLTFAPQVEPMYGGPSPKLVDEHQQPLPAQKRNCVQLKFPGGFFFFFSTR